MSLIPSWGIKLFTGVVHLVFLHIAGEWKVGTVSIAEPGDERSLDARMTAWHRDPSCRPLLYSGISKK